MGQRFGEDVADPNMHYDSNSSRFGFNHFGRANKVAHKPLRFERLHHRSRHSIRVELVTNAAPKCALVESKSDGVVCRARYGIDRRSLTQMDNGEVDGDRTK